MIASSKAAALFSRAWCGMRRLCEHRKRLSAIGRSPVSKAAMSDWVIAPAHRCAGRLSTYCFDRCSCDRSPGSRLLPSPLPEEQTPFRNNFAVIRIHHKLSG